MSTGLIFKGKKGLICFTNSSSKRLDQREIEKWNSLLCREVSLRQTERERERESETKRQRERDRERERESDRQRKRKRMRE